MIGDGHDICPDLVFPETEHDPPGIAELLVRLAISCDVPQELRLPPLAVGVWDVPVLGTHVPEAPVHEDGHARRPEDDVHSLAPVAEHSTVHAVPKAASMKLPP